MASTIPTIITSNIEALINQMLPPIIQTAVDTGIENIGESNMKLPDTCLPQNNIQSILNLRNSLQNKLNAVSKTVESLSKVTDILQPAIDTTNTSLNVAKTVVNTTTQIMLALPPTTPVPPQLITGLVNAVTLVNGTLPPILTTNINKLDSITTAVDFANNMLLKLNNLLSAIDQYLIKCGININDLVPLDNRLQQLQITLNQSGVNLNDTNQVYKGFILEIVEEPYSSTTTRRKAVAKNTQGIILLSTPLTFSTENQVLINEIKLLIDSNNLKAD